MRDRDFKEIVAFHEAGHAVMTVYCGWKVREVVLRSPWSGYCWGRRPILPEAKRPLTRVVQITDTIKDLKILLAGPVAECEFRNLPWDAVHNGDTAIVFDILSDEYFGELFDTYLPNAYDVIKGEVIAWVAIPENWQSIRAVAEHLIIKGRLDGEDVVDLIVKARESKAQLSLFDSYLRKPEKELKRG